MLFVDGKTIPGTSAHGILLVAKTWFSHAELLVSSQRCLPTVVAYGDKPVLNSSAGKLLVCQACCPLHTLGWSYPSSFVLERIWVHSSSVLYWQNFCFLAPAIPWVGPTTTKRPWAHCVCQQDRKAKDTHVLTNVGLWRMGEWEWERIKCFSFCWETAAAPTAVASFITNSQWLNVTDEQESFETCSTLKGLGSSAPAACRSNSCSSPFQ